MELFFFVRDMINEDKIGLVEEPLTKLCERIDDLITHFDYIKK